MDKIIAENYISKKYNGLFHPHLCWNFTPYCVWQLWCWVLYFSDLCNLDGINIIFAKVALLWNQKCWWNWPQGRNILERISNLPRRNSWFSTISYPKPRHILSNGHTKANEKRKLHFPIEGKIAVKILKSLSRERSLVQIPN